MDVLEAQARAGKTVIASTHDLLCAAQRFHQAALLNGTLVAPRACGSWCSTRRLLAATYGGHVLVLPGETGAPWSSTMPITTTSRPAASVTSTRARDGARRSAHRPAQLPVHAAGRSWRPWSGVVCAVMGTFVVLKGLAFIGDAVSHAAFPGLVVAYMLGWPLYVGGAIAAVATSLAIGWVSRRSRLRFDTSVGVLFAGMFAFGVCSSAPSRTTSAICSATSSAMCWPSRTDDLIQVVVLGAGCSVIVVLRKELLFATFDPGAPRRPGCRWRPRVPPPGAAGRDHRRQHPGRGHHPGGRDAGHAGGHGAAARHAVRPADAARGRARYRVRGRRAVYQLLLEPRRGSDHRAVRDAHVRAGAAAGAAHWYRQAAAGAATGTGRGAGDQTG